MEHRGEDNETGQQRDKCVSQHDHAGPASDGEIIRQVGAIGHHAAHAYSNGEKSLSDCREKGSTGDFAEIWREQPLQCLDEAARKIVVNTQPHQQREHQRHHNRHGTLNAGGHTCVDNSAHDHITDQGPYHHGLIVCQQTGKCGLGCYRVKISKPCE